VFAIIVDDVDAACAELEHEGVRLLNGPQDRPWGMRTANFQDPDGYVWEIATELDQDIGKPASRALLAETQRKS
jgi:uncharacterized glyoxalase superfamily protein PhnB